ncbi:MAG: non-homologous end-joining DNA ligase [Bacteriovoracia bacterium]
MSIQTYNKKRNFKKTSEPKGKKTQTTGPLRFVVQMHAASHLHYDLRLEMGGVLKSWAVPKGPSLNPQEQRLAVFVEDHPIDYGTFEGLIPKGNYGAGTVMLWDEGTYIERNSTGRQDSEKAMLSGLAKGHITFVLSGKKLNGEFALVRFKRANEKSWLLIKKRDEFSRRDDITKQAFSVKTGRTMQEIAANAKEKGDVWLSKQNKTIPRLTSSKKITKSNHETTPKGISKKTPASSNMLRKVKPMLARVASEPFDQDDWIFEPNNDGIRIIAEIENGKVHLYSRSLLPLERKYASIADVLKNVKDTLVLDGEILKQGDKDIIFFFDLLYCNGKDYRRVSLEKRKEKLASLNIYSSPIFYRDHIEKYGRKAFEKAKKENLPALLAKDKNSIYESGVSKYWLKFSVNNESSEQTEPLRPQHFSNTDKIFFPKDKLTKGDIIEYYKKVASTILPYLKDKPQSLHRHPHGIGKKSFFQKDVIGHLPKWVETIRIFSESANKSVNYLLCQNENTLLYLANLGCIELNPWLSKKTSLESPEMLVIDLDPDGNSMEEISKTALATKKILERIGATSFCKTSGATGLHICVPTLGKFDYDTVRVFAEKVCTLVHRKLPSITSVERSPAKRRGKIYLDFLQNRKGQTLAAPYCVRPLENAPVSTPLEWSEVTAKLVPRKFTILNILARLEKKGDLWLPTLSTFIDLNKCIEPLEKLLK